MRTRAEATTKRIASPVPRQSLQRPAAEQRAGLEPHPAPVVGPRFELGHVLGAPRIQRKCAGCGGSMQDDDRPCAACSGTIAREAAGTQTTTALPVSEPGDRLEVEADRAADQALRTLHGDAAHAPPDDIAPTAPRIQRQAVEAAPEPAAAPEQTAAPEPAAAAPEQAAADAAPEAAAGGLIVDDDAQSLTAGQMRKTEFLDALKVDACAAADRELASVGRDTQGCPYVERWLDYYREKDAGHLERAIRKFAPGTAAARTARDYIPIVSARVAAGTARWARTGQLPADVPPELRDAVMGGAGGIGGALAAIGGAIGGALSSIGRLFFKADGGGPAGVDRAALSSRLGPGTPLDGGARTRMEAAYGHSFGSVRIHADSRAAALSRDLDAHAFTLGEHVAFAEGRYRPGTPVGDALLAHELAHVIQQGGDAGPAPAAEISQRDEPAERDADAAAVSALTAIYAPGAGARRASVSRKRAGLRLQRCGASFTPRPRTGVRTGEGQGTLPPLQPGQRSQSYSVEEYIRAWEQQHNQTMPDAQRRVLYGGCIGITALNLGESSYGPGHPPMSFCYDTLAHAQAAASAFEQASGVRPYIFSKHFYSRGRSYTPDPTGRVEMRQHDFFADRASGTFDYGWYDEANNTFLDANHCDPRAPGCNTSEAMRIIQNTPEAWASQVQPGTDYDVGVYCIWHPSWPSEWRIPN